MKERRLFWGKIGKKCAFFRKLTTNFIISSKQNRLYSETLNNEYIERTPQMSYSSLSDNGMLQIFSFLIK